MQRGLVNVSSKSVLNSFLINQIELPKTRVISILVHTNRYILPILYRSRRNNILGPGPGNWKHTVSLFLLQA